MIQVSELRHPGIKIFKGDPLAADHFALKRYGHVALQNVRDGPGHNPPGTDGIGQQPRSNDIADGKYFGIVGLIPLVNFDEPIFLSNGLG